MILKFNNILATFIFIYISAGSIVAQSDAQTSTKVKINIKKSISPLVVRDNSIELNKGFAYPNNHRREVLISIKSKSNKKKYSIFHKQQIDSAPSIKNYSWISDFNENNIISRINNEYQFSEIANSLQNTSQNNIIIIVY